MAHVEVNKVGETDVQASSVRKVNRDGPQPMLFMLEHLTRAEFEAADTYARVA